MSDTAKTATTQAQPATVMVHVRATQRISYSQTVEMPRVTWEHLEALLADAEDGDDDAETVLADEADEWIDKHDVFDAEEMEDVEFTLAPATPDKE